ncbi:MAG TPA: hypothetical protein VHY59_13475, partial [Chthoniobacterales bacterium]|nr:hypothetical protein [Chthoniobacterales bacterium]
QPRRLTLPASTRGRRRFLSPRLVLANRTSGATLKARRLNLSNFAALSGRITFFIQYLGLSPG